MRLPRVRFTVRTLTIVVVGAALLAGGIVLWRRSARYQRTAHFHAHTASRFRAEQRSKASTAKAGREQAEMWMRLARATGSKTAEEAAEAAGPGIAVYEAAARAAGAKADYHTLLGEKYTHAAARPWLPMEPDPSPP